MSVSETAAAAFVTTLPGRWTRKTPILDHAGATAQPAQPPPAPSDS